MYKTIKRSILFGMIAIFLVAFIFLPAQAQENEDQPVVRAVLFYSPSCGHCENVIQNVLPPLLKQYGNQLKIVAINVTLPDGQALYQASIEQFEIPDNMLGVPTLIVDDIVMVGGEEIPSEFPGIVAEKISVGGTDWPDIPGLADIITGVKFSSQPTDVASSGSETSFRQTQESQSMFDKFMIDPTANSIAVIVLVLMLGSIIWVIIRFNRPLPEKDFWPSWIIPLISIFGIGVAFYLTYVETSGAEAVCGPVGDCNTVQVSPYAMLFGVLPVGLLGLIGYALLLVGWILNRFGPSSIRWISAIAVWGMALFGVLFSIYLTFLEPFVIGASCMWCIASAIFQTVIFLAATGPAKRAWQVDDFDEEYIDADSVEAESLLETEKGVVDVQVDSAGEASEAVDT